MANSSDAALQSNLLADRLSSRANHFNLIRLILATAVCFDHAGLVALNAPRSELLWLFDVTAGHLAVNGFFFLSGLLITRSLDQSSSLKRYGLSRMLRLYPALVIFVLIGCLIIGPAVATGAYWSDLGWLSYGLNVLVFGETSGAPPGFFPGNPVSEVYSPPLWTLRYEVLCYIAAPFAALAMRRLGKSVLITGLIALGGLVLVLEPVAPRTTVPELIVHLSRLGFAFGLGMAAWTFREQIERRWIALAVTSLLFVLSGLSSVALDLTASLWISAVILCFGLLPALPSKQGGETDISYGMYIWHYPVMQILLGLSIVTTPWGVLGLGILLTVPVAWLSWTLIEHPALKLKSRLKAPRRI